MVISSEGDGTDERTEDGADAPPPPTDSLNSRVGVEIRDEIRPFMTPPGNRLGALST